MKGQAGLVDTRDIGGRRRLRGSEEESSDLDSQGFIHISNHSGPQWPLLMQFYRPFAQTVYLAMFLVSALPHTDAEPEFLRLLLGE